MKFYHYILVVLLAVSGGWLGTKITPISQNSTPAQETAYERVMRTGTLRCGYSLWDGGINEDPNTKQLTGAAYDVANAIGAAANIKIEWAGRVPWGDVVEALKSNKVDAICAGMWTNALKAKQIAFTTPFAYQGVEAFGQVGTARFDNNLPNINATDVKVATIDNDNSDYIAREVFPNAERVALSQLNSSDMDLMMYVGTRKADVTFTAVGLWHLFEKDQPSKVKRIAPGQNLRTFGLSPVVVDNADPRLWLMLDAAAHEVMDSGIVDRILDKYDTRYPDMFLRAAKNYK
ncbi:MAG: transporter substrate-binding domain-containing protein [Bdellovibrionales bacterium]